MGFFDNIDWEKLKDSGIFQGVQRGLAQYGGNLDSILGMQNARKEKQREDDRLARERGDKQLARATAEERYAERQAWQKKMWEADQKWKQAEKERRDRLDYQRMINEDIGLTQNQEEREAEQKRWEAEQALQKKKLEADQAYRQERALQNDMFKQQSILSDESDRKARRINQVNNQVASRKLKEQENLSRDIYRNEQLQLEQARLDRQRERDAQEEKRWKEFDDKIGSLVNPDSPGGKAVIVGGMVRKPSLVGRGFSMMNRANTQAGKAGKDRLTQLRQLYETMYPKALFGRRPDGAPSFEVFVDSGEGPRLLAKGQGRTPGNQLKVNTGVKPAPQEAVNELMKNPSLAKEFYDKYRYLPEGFKR